ncbi:MAG: wax ester/triacylglycerol synthase family O-acyltransferase [Burkholderiaceae bacterium]
MVTRINARSAAPAVSRTGRPVTRRARVTTAPSAGTAAGTVLEDSAAGTQGLSGERMSKVDTAWLRMDCASNRMVIVGVWVFKPGIRRADLRQRVAERLLRYPRFCQRVEQSALGASWVHDADFDIDRHVVLETLAHLPKGREQDALQDRLGQLAVRPLDPRHPLWQFHLVEHYDGGSAVLVRIHHCIGDGIALLSVIQSLMDGGAPPPEHRLKSEPRAGLDGAQDWIADAVIRPLTSLAVQAIGGAGDAMAGAFDLLAEPRKDGDKRVGGGASMARLAWQLARDAAALALMPDDASTRLKGIPGNQKRVAWCAPIALDEVRAVGKALNCSINDVLLSCVAGAIGEYLRAHGDAVQGLEIRAMVPVNLRAPQDAYQLGNRFGLAPIVLPIGLANPIQRVYAVRRRMGALKGSLQPLLTFGLLAVAGLLVKPAQDAMLGVFSRKTTAVMTNVPGPREKLQFLGSTLEQTLFWVPQSGSVGLGVSILSYGGGVQFGVISDTTLCPDPQKIIDGFAPEFAKLCWLTLMLPWSQ